MIETILQSGIINLSVLARRLYPNKKASTASNTLRAKVNGLGFNKLNQAEKEQIFKIISNIEFSFREDLTKKEGK